MSVVELGKLEHEELRIAFPGEASHFTPWLALPENLADLGKIIGIELELVSTEQYVGPFRADILCKDTSTGRYVLIENQLEATDHTHLGQILTYAAGLKACAIVWLAKRFTDEHRAALDWINELGKGELYCFGLEIELWKIGNSALAPKFNVVSQPNEWTSRIPASTSATPLTDVGAFYESYWMAFKAYMDEHSSLIRARRPYAQNWAEFAVGRSDFSLQVWLNREKKWLDVSLVIGGTNAKRYYQLLVKDKEEIESLLGPLNWYEMPQKKWCYISRTSEPGVMDPEDQLQWTVQFAWLQERLEAYRRVFEPKLKALRLDTREVMPPAAAVNILDTD